MLRGFRVQGSLPEVLSKLGKPSFVAVGILVVNEADWNVVMLAFPTQ
jgi:hypothetical protein